MPSKQISLVILGVVLVVLVALLSVFYKPTPPPTSGNPSELTYKDLIKVIRPGQNEVVSNPLVVEGQARGSWYFEASFPVVLVDWDGKIIAQGPAQAQGEPGAWMTSDYVPFKATLTFNLEPGTPSDRGALILRKDNPSGLPANDDAFEIPIRFNLPAPTPLPTILPYQSGVRGRVTLGPTCPVEQSVNGNQVDPGPNCAPKGYSTKIEIYHTGGALFANAMSDANGNYEVALPPGDYMVHAVGGNTLPRCSDATTVVGPSSYNVVDISCDTGIR